MLYSVSSRPVPPLSVAFSVTVTGTLYVPPGPGRTGLSDAVVTGGVLSAASSTATSTVRVDVSPSAYVTVSVAVYSPAAGYW